MENELIAKNLIDHKILYYEWKYGDDIVHFYSLNIAQKSDLRTMLMFNKIHSFLKGFDISDVYINTDFFDEIPDLILKYNLHLECVKEGSKIQIDNKAFLIDLQAIVKRSFENVYLRRYCPNGKRKTDDVFMKRFEKTNFNYIDIIFKEETIVKYRERIRKVLSTVYEKCKNKKNVLLCFQEIRPVSEFVKELSLFSAWKLIDPQNPNDIEKSSNILVAQNFPYHIRRVQTTNHDDVLKVFEHKVFENGQWSAQRNCNQNIKYYIQKYHLYFYNIHGYLYRDNQVLEEMENNIIPYLQERKSSSHVIIGDFNFKMKSSICKKLKDICKTANMYIKLIPSLSNAYTKTYDGIITFSNRP